MHKLGYLAAPYQHVDPEVCRKRLQAVTLQAAMLFQQGIYVFSPLTHNVPIKDLGVMLGNWEVWKEYDELLLSRCDLLYVLQLEGWEKSKGVSAEIALAKKLKLPIEMLPPPLGYERTFSEKMLIP